MVKSNSILLPKAQKAAQGLGDNIKLARLRRRLSAQQVSERAGISRPTLLSIEKGDPNVTMGSYIKVLFVLGLGEDISHVAKDDVLGRRLQDSALIVKERAPKRTIKRKTDENGQ